MVLYIVFVFQRTPVFFRTGNIGTATIVIYTERTKKTSLFRIKTDAVRKREAQVTRSLERWTEFRCDVLRTRKRHIKR